MQERQVTRAMATAWVRRTCTAGLLTAILMAGSGCLSFCHPIEPASPEVAFPIITQPKCCRDQVYIFMIDGLDPLDFANLHGLRDYIQSLGFKNTYFGQMYHTLQFEHEMARICHADPGAHFVLIGFGFGDDMIRHMASAAADAGAHIDLLFCLGGNTSEPSRAGTIEMVTTALAGLVGTTQPIEQPDLPMPRTIHSTSAKVHDDWGFLAPRDNLQYKFSPNDPLWQSPQPAAVRAAWLQADRRVP